MLACGILGRGNCVAARSAVLSHPYPCLAKLLQRRDSVAQSLIASVEGSTVDLVDVF